MEARDYAPVLKWLLVSCLVVLGLLTLWQLGFLDTVVRSDRTRLSLIIFGLFVATSIHCFIQALQISNEQVAARKTRAILETEGIGGLRLTADGVATASGASLPPGPLTAHIANLLRKASRLRSGDRLDQTLLLRNAADRLRSREKIGIFVAEALLRLALLGTAIGFILMLIPIAQLSSFDADTLRGALSGMTGGMAIALNVTVSGIAGALVLKFEYYQLDGAIAELFHQIAETSEIYVVPSIERSADGRA
jgi:hypothetical protein